MGTISGENETQENHDRLPDKKPEFYGDADAEEITSKQKEDFGVSHNLLSELQKVKDEFLGQPPEQKEELDEEDLPDDFWSQKST